MKIQHTMLGVLAASLLVACGSTKTIVEAPSEDLPVVQLTKNSFINNNTYSLLLIYETYTHEILTASELEVRSAYWSDGELKISVCGKNIFTEELIYTKAFTITYEHSCDPA